MKVLRNLMNLRPSLPHARGFSSADSSALLTNSFAALTRAQICSWSPSVSALLILVGQQLLDDVRFETHLCITFSPPK